MELYPIGTVATGTSLGTIDNVSYKMFEPNSGCKSIKVHSNLLTTFQDKAILARKKAEPYLNIVYEYTYIFDREFKQIEHFVDSVDDSLTTFYTVAWDRGSSPDSIASSAGTWRVTIDYTRDYSATSNMKSNYMLVSDGKKWKMGDVSEISANNYVDVSVDEGALTHSSIEIKKILVYPVYEVRFLDNVLNNFEKLVYWNDTISRTAPGGMMRSGNTTFISKYKVGKYIDA